MSPPPAPVVTPRQSYHPDFVGFHFIWSVSVTFPPLFSLGGRHAEIVSEFSNNSEVKRNDISSGFVIN